MRKKIVYFFLGILPILILMFSNNVFGAAVSKKIEVVFNSVKFVVNGKQMKVDNFQYNGTTYVPVGAVAEMLGKEVQWNSITKTLSINDKVTTTPAPTPTPVCTPVLTTSSPKATVSPALKEETFNRGGNVVELGDWIYYKRSGDRFLCKSTKDGKNKTLLVEQEIGELCAYKGSIYYTCFNPNNKDMMNVPKADKIYRINSDGTSNTKIADGTNMYSLNIIGDKIYYIDNIAEGAPFEHDGKICAINLNGDNSSVLDQITNPTCLYVSGESMYYIEESNAHIYKAKTNGSQKMELVNTNVKLMDIEGSWIYYLNSSDNKIYKVQINGSNKTPVSNSFNSNGHNSQLYSISVKKGCVFFDYDQFDGKTMVRYFGKISADGITSVFSLANISIIRQVTDEWIYFFTADWKFAKMRHDGIGEQLL